MTKRSFRGVVATTLVMQTMTAMATAGPAWVEPGDDDAGSLPAIAQPTVGDGPLAAIIGTLDGLSPATGEPDLHDMFFIFIDDPDNFRATTVAPGMAGFDSRLFLFQVITVGAGEEIVGLGLLGNDNAGGNAGGSGFGLTGAGDLFGACCFPDGTCEEMGAYECDLEGGSFQGDESTCLGANCTGSTLGNEATDNSGAMIEAPGLYLLTITVSSQDPVSDGGIIFDFEDPDEVSGPD
ncbi:MAG: hypothetical protein ACYSU7_04435, partial [Planctomycetota bacterium]